MDDIHNLVRLYEAVRSAGFYSHCEMIGSAGPSVFCARFASDVEYGRPAFSIMCSSGRIVMFTLDDMQWEIADISTAVALTIEWLQSSCDSVIPPDTLMNRAGVRALTNEEYGRIFAVHNIAGFLLWLWATLRTQISELGKDATLQQLYPNGRVSEGRYLPTLPDYRFAIIHDEVWRIIASSDKDKTTFSISSEGRFLCEIRSVGTSLFHDD